MDLSSTVAEATRERLVARFGARAEPWWAWLPDIVDELAERWQLTLGQPVGGGGTSLVLRCRRADGAAAMLKLCPDAELVRAEARALRAWRSSGRVPLVWGCAIEQGALLLEALPDETPLADRPAAAAVQDIAALLRALHGSGAPAVGEGLVSLAERVAFVFGHWLELRGRDEATAHAVPAARLERGRDLAGELAAGGGQPVLLHGDLHPGNVLDGGPGRGLVAIDPRPCVGDAAFDAVDWVFWGLDDARGWEHRSRLLAAALGGDAARQWAWCGALAALLAASAARRGESPARVAALLAIAP